MVEHQYVHYDIGELKKLAWNGIPNDLRRVAWQLLLVRTFLYEKHQDSYHSGNKGYLPLHSDMRTSTLARKRAEYASLVNVIFAKGREGLNQQEIWRQIGIDVPRTKPDVKLWMYESTQRVSQILVLVYLRYV